MTPGPTKTKVLLVDDEESVLRALSRHLQQAGFAVDTSAEPLDAVTRAGRHEYDVIVSDISMPGMNGIELLRTVRQQDRDLPVILMTGAPSLESVTEAIEQGVFKYIQKPVAAKELLEAVERAAQLYRIGKTKREALVALGTSDGEGADRFSLEASFERALSSLWVAFQPIVRASDRSIFGYEALLRCAEATLPHPGAVLNAAERLGELPRLGRSVRRLAVEKMAEAPPTAMLFLNLHPQDLKDPDLYDPSACHLRIADRLVLEITERSSLDGVDEVEGRLASLRGAGCRIAVDDLGAGYAGLSSFVQLEPDLVKLDITLVRDVDRNPVKQKLVRSMTTLCKDMGLMIVAEGVETAEERDLLIDLGCDLLQGYRFGRPSASFADPAW